MERKPGELTQRALEKMRSYLGAQGHRDAEDPTCPVMATYFTSVYLPSCQGKLSARNEQEMRVLSEAIDSILEPDLGRASDLLMQQYKSVEQCHADGGSWRAARHLSVVADGKVTVMEDRERQGILRDEKTDMKYTKLQSEVHGRKSAVP